eukprot:gene18417-biopygen12355
MTKVVPDISGLRERYQTECEVHEINYVQRGIITPLKFKIEDFAVNLRIREEESSPAVDKTFHGEMARHMGSLKDDAHSIEVEELLNMVKDDKHRIFFVGGVAGIGKSVLAKRIAYDWSCNEKYRNHFQGKESGNQDLGWEIFSHYSEQLLEICKQAFKLYRSGSIIFKKKELECKDEKFIEGFLLGVKNKAGIITKYMFKHLTIMEFLASIHVYLDGKRNELLEELLREERYEIISFVCSFVRFSLIKETSFEEDDELSYQLVEKLANGKEVAENRGDGVITYEDAQSVIREILKQLPNDEVLLKVRFLADCFVASDKVRDVKFLEELLKSIKPSSNVEVKLNTFDESNLLSILKLATGNEVANSEIKNAFSGIKFYIYDLREMEILDYALWIDINWVHLNGVNHFTADQLMLVHRNVAFCGEVWFYNCKVPLFTTNANESTTKMKLKELAMTSMKIDQSEVSSAANLFCLAEKVVLQNVQVGGNEFEKIMEKVFQIEPRRLRMMELENCRLVNHDLKQKMRENGVTIIEHYKRNNAEMASELNWNIPAIMDKKFIVISNAPGNQVEANEIKQKFADEIGCPVFVNIELWKYLPRVVVVLLTDGYEESHQCMEMMKYDESGWKIIEVKLDNDFQPGYKLNYIVRESTCICWTDEANFDANFAKVKEEINAKFEQEYHNPDAKTQKWERLQTSVISKYVNWKKAGKLIAGTSSECLEKLSELSSFSQLENVLNDWKDYPKILDSMRMLKLKKS